MDAIAGVLGGDGEEMLTCAWVEKEIERGTEGGVERETEKKGLSSYWNNGPESKERERERERERESIHLRGRTPFQSVRC